MTMSTFRLEKAKEAVSELYTERVLHEDKNHNNGLTMLHTFVLIWSLLYCWLFVGSALVLGCASEKEKNKSVKLVSREGKLF